ncbi:1-deoxy-D-xylulose-5-phosphate synthase [Mycobacterium angelicum]|uniref:1-deoxy-D-xylulose-5-phosphate synthase n=1 Tax=Mycobacterium angelicum TaxID=470074 RepID=UPI001FECC1F1|nr:1-deoxy-D-xylulose-5-phosphate synthase [Mycobacterium angelicum]
MTLAMPASQTDLLSTIRGPQDVQAFADDQLSLLARQIRQRMIETVTSTGGHLGAGLGTVELTIALHRVFCSPRDIVVFDTGHQTYPHKLLTGRSEQFAALRQSGGLSGYPNRSESAHDWVENSHASVSLAWVDGIAKALALQGRRDRRVVGVIGDGALTGGVAWEGLNNLGGAARPAIIVLNDNGRSYDPTTGAIATHLAALRSGVSVGPNLFEALGFTYIGPVDGHDIAATCSALRRAAALDSPVVVHTVTAKGRGYPPAEADEDDRMHACGVIDVATGRPTATSPPSWTEVFEAELVRVADERPEIVAMTAAMRLPAGLGALSRKYPDRVFDSGIAEQHLLACAAGLASAGAHPVVALYSTFLHRAFDQLLFDVGLHRLPVTLVLDRAGITGPDGASHHGMWDLALLTNVPGLRIACPRDAARLRQQLAAAIADAAPTALRYPKGSPGKDIPAIGHVDGVDILYRNETSHRDVLLIAVGAMARPCVDAAECLDQAGVGVTVVDPGWVWPLNPALTELAGQHRIAVCVEDGVADAGIGTHLNHHIGNMSPQTRIHSLGLPREYIPHASRNQILAECGLSGSAISATCLMRLELDSL